MTAVETHFYPLTVASIAPETADAVKIGFNIPPEVRNKFSHKPGQYLTIKSDSGPDPIRRSYSICSGINDAELQIAIKRIEGGQFSNFANDAIKVGDTIHAMPPEGNFSAVLHKDHEKKYLFKNLLGVFVNIFLNYFLIKSYGALGAAYATLITLFIVNYVYDLLDKDLRRFYYLKLICFLPYKK